MERIVFAEEELGVGQQEKGSRNTVIDSVTGPPNFVEEPILDAVPPEEQVVQSWSKNPPVSEESIKCGAQEQSEVASLLPRDNLVEHGSPVSIGDGQSNEDTTEEELSPGGTVTRGTAEGWSIVDPPDNSDSDNAAGKAQTGNPDGDTLLFSYKDKPSSSLRRRSRSSSTATEGGSSSVDIVELSKSQYSERLGSLAMGELQQVRHPPVEPVSRDLEDTKGKTLLESEDSDTVSEVGGEKALLKEKEPKFDSGYDSEMEDDDMEATVSREADNDLDVLERTPSVEEKSWEEVGSFNTSDERGPIADMGRIREVYRMPESDVDGEESGGETRSQVSLNPAGLIFQAIGFQVRLIVRLVAIAFWLCEFSFSLISRPINRTLEATDRATDMATGAVNQGLGFISSVREGVSQTGPVISKISKKTVWGCLGAAYVIFMLGLLLIPALFLDLVLVNHIVEEPVNIQKTLDFDYTQPRPTALVPLFSAQEVERVKSLPPEKKVTTRVIPASHKFHITAILTLPESDHNMNLGMFQVTAELLSARNQVLMRSSKPCRLQFSSYPVRLAKTLLYGFSLLVGLSSESQRLEIRLLEAQEKVIPTAAVRILLEPKASSGSVPELYDAEVRLESVLPWSKAIIRQWKWTFYVWFGVSLFLFEVALVLCCCRQVLIPGLGWETGDEKEIVEAEVKDERLSTDNKVPRRPRSKRRVYFQDGIAGAAGPHDVEDTGIPVDEKADNAGGLSAVRDSGWSVPPFEDTLVDSEEGVKVMRQTFRNLGDTLVEGMSEGLDPVFP